MKQQRKEKAKQIIDSADSFMLFSFKEDVGSNTFCEYEKIADYYAIMHFVKLFVEFQKKKEAEEGEAFFNQESSLDEDKQAYFG